MTQKSRIRSNILRLALLFAAPLVLADAPALPDITLAGHTYNPTSIAYSPDGSRLVSAAWDGTIRLWDVQTGALLKTFGGGAGDAYAVAFSPDGKMLASAGEEKTIQVWDVKTGKVVQIFSAEGAPIRSLAFSPDGKSLAAADTDYSGRVYLLSAPAPE